MFLCFNFYSLYFFVFISYDFSFRRNFYFSFSAVKYFVYTINVLRLRYSRVFFLFLVNTIIQLRSRSFLLNSSNRIINSFFVPTSVGRFSFYSFFIRFFFFSFFSFNSSAYLSFFRFFLFYSSYLLYYSICFLDHLDFTPSVYSIPTRHTNFVLLRSAHVDKRARVLLTYSRFYLNMRFRSFFSILNLGNFSMFGTSFRSRFSRKLVLL